jgi:chemosensory pili system protein ChpA (sensor histidine kinase/response regulator)
MLDDQVINALIDPLMHIVRNAVDHGIEPPTARTAAGKPAAGTLTLAFSRIGSHILIQCSDDGAGLDLQRIHGAAVARGLIDYSEPLEDGDIARLILLPGFSTHDTASEISGRGVGMDIVHTNVRKLKGHLDIHTEAGQGTTFALRLPITLGTAHCLLIECGGELVAIPSDALDHAVYLGEKNIQRLGAQWTYRDDRNTCAVDDLAHLLGFPTQRQFGEPGDPRTVLIVNGMEGKRAVVVDKLLSGRDLVIKSAGKHLANLSGVVGASLLGDGRVVPVLDMHDLLVARRQRHEYAAQPVGRSTHAQRAFCSEILVVDDSLSVRQALSQLLNSEGYQVRTARDGVEALELIDKAKPAALVVDLEMPRMNGLELTSRLRARDDTLRLPVIMVTSRSSDKHRSQAQRLGVDLYLTKPYRENDLLAQLRGMLSKAA